MKTTNIDFDCNWNKCGDVSLKLIKEDDNQEWRWNTYTRQQSRLQEEQTRKWECLSYLPWLMTTKIQLMWYIV